MKKFLAVAIATIVTFGGLGVVPSVADSAKTEITASAEDETSNLKKIFEDYIEEKRIQEQQNYSHDIAMEINNYVEDGDVAYGTYGICSYPNDEHVHYDCNLCVITDDGVNEYTWNDEKNALQYKKSIKPFSIGNEKFIAVFGGLWTDGCEFPNGYEMPAVSVFHIVDSKPQPTSIDGLLIDTEVEYNEENYSYYKQYPDVGSDNVEDFITINDDSITFDGAKYTWDSEIQDFNGAAICYEKLIPEILKEHYEEAKKESEEAKKENPGITDYDGDLMLDYLIYDMNHDGIPELVLNCGGSESDSEIRVFTFDGTQAKEIGQGSGSHRHHFAENDKGQLVAYGTHEWRCLLDTYAYDGSNITVSEKDFKYDNFEEFDNKFKQGNFTDLESGSMYGKLNPEYDLLAYQIPVDYSYIRHAVAEIENSKPQESEQPSDNNQQNAGDEQNNNQSSDNNQQNNTADNTSNTQTNNNADNNTDNSAATSNPNTGSAAPLGVLALSGIATLICTRRKKK